jgi:hypothetical protein
MTFGNLSARAPGRALRNRREDIGIVWRQNLPREWQEMVVAPLQLDSQRDYEMAAERVIGRDEDDEPCYCVYRYIVTETRSDDDEEFYQIAAYAESLSAWRLRDGRWLIHRLIARDGEPGTGFYSFSETMPR